MTEDKSIPKNLWREIFHQKFLKRHLHLRISEEKFYTKKTIPKGMFYQKFPEEKLSTKKSLKKSFYKNVFEEEPPPKKTKKLYLYQNTLKRNFYKQIRKGISTHNISPKKVSTKFFFKRNLYPKNIQEKSLQKKYFRFD